MEIQKATVQEVILCGRFYTGSRANSIS